jgi:hypothetical protein
MKLAPQRLQYGAERLTVVDVEDVDEEEDGEGRSGMSFADQVISYQSSVAD